MIGFFDSGFGGLTVLREAAKTLPDYSYLYLGDNARTPYGSHSPQTIYEYTLEGVEELFRQGANLVILACNTASAVALKKLQKEYLPVHHPGKTVLGIIIPVAEEVKYFKSKTIGVFATETTVNSNAFAIEIAKTNPALETVHQACPLLVPMIEAGEIDGLDIFVEKYVKDLFAKNSKIGSVVLGCTHYAIIEDVFRKFIPKEVEIVSQGKIVAQSLGCYLENHPEIEKRLEKECARRFLTTEDSAKIEHLADMFYGEKAEMEVAKISSIDIS